MVSIQTIKNNKIIIVIAIMLFYVGIAFLSDINKISTQFMKIRFEFIIPILAIELLSLILRGVRQQELLHSIDIKLSPLMNLKIYFAGLAMVATPAGGGQVIKSHMIKKTYGHSISKTLPIVLLERFHDLLAVVFLIGFSLLFSYNWPSALIAAISSALLLMLYVIFRYKQFFVKFQKIFSRIKIVQKFLPSPELNASIERLSRPRIMTLSLLISLGSWILDATAVYLSFIAFSQDLGFMKVIQFYLTSIAYGALSLLPGGIGITEGSFLGLLTSTGLGISLSISLVLFARITTIWFATILGFISTRLVLKKKQ